MSSKYIWVVTYDHLDDLPVLVVGPNNADEREIYNRCKTPFRMYDDDGELYYSGLMCDESEDSEGNGPLMDYGMPNAGAVRLDWKNPKTGEWEGLVG